jgi:hypothetical protein
MKPLGPAPSHALGDISPERLARLVERAGESMREFYQAGRRSSLTSPMFNVPGRMTVGGEVYFRHLPDLLRELDGTVGVDELAGRAGALCTRPHYLSMQSFMHGYLNGREQRRIDAGLVSGEPLADERREDLAVVMDFWDRAMRAYLRADLVLPEETGGAIRPLSPDAVAALAATLRPVTEDETAWQVTVRRAVATAELYTFIANGESRVGVFHYGPYPLPGGDILLIKELNGLQDRFLPWEDVPLPPFENLARVMRLRGVGARIGAFGTLVTDPLEYEASLVAEQLVTRVNGELRSLADDDIGALQTGTSLAQLRMYEEAAGWDAVRQVAYGADLYAALLLPWFQAAGVDLRDRVVALFRSVADEIAPVQLGSTEGEFYEWHSITANTGTGA